MNRYELWTNQTATQRDGIIVEASSLSGAIAQVEAESGSIVILGKRL